MKINRYKDLESKGYGSRQTIWRKVNAGVFPKPLNILGRPGWTDEQLDSVHENAQEWEVAKAS